MSDHIPYVIQVEIMKRLPVKSLIRFRSVSKEWKALIDSSDFIGDYSLRHAHQPQCYLVRYIDQTVTKYVSFVDDQSFPQPNFAPTLPLFVRQLNYSIVVGSSRGLLCLFGRYQEQNYNTEMAVLWNPSIQRSVGILVPNVFYGEYETILGFGVCPNTNDPKIVKIIQMCDILDIEIGYGFDYIGSIPSEIEVFTLSSGVWRVPCSNLPSDTIEVTMSQVAIDGFIYWLANDWITMDDGFWRIHNLIMLFDLASEEIRVVGLPDSLALQPARALSISRLRESLAVLEYSQDTENRVCGVWMMERGVPNSFTKLFIVEAPHALINTVLGFRKSGESMVVVKDNDNEELATLFTYEPDLQQINNLGIHGRDRSFFMSSYMETLLLLDHSDGSIIDDDDDDGKVRSRLSV